MVPEIDPRALALELSGENPPSLLDVREPHELGISVLPNVVHVPMGELVDRLDELDPNANWVVVCRTGGRSARVTAFLIGQGFSQVRNLCDGMNGWATQVDPTVTIY